MGAGGRWTVIVCEAYLKLDPGKWVALAVGALPLALAAQLQAQEPPPYRAAHPAQSGEQAEIDAALRACGLDHLSIVYDPELQMLALHIPLRGAVFVIVCLARPAVLRTLAAQPHPRSNLSE